MCRRLTLKSDIIISSGNIITPWDNKKANLKRRKAILHYTKIGGVGGWQKGEMRWPRAIGTKWSDKTTVHCDVQLCSRQDPSCRRVKLPNIFNGFSYQSLYYPRVWENTSPRSCLKIFAKRSNKCNVLRSFTTLCSWLSWTLNSKVCCRFFIM